MEDTLHLFQVIGGYILGFTAATLLFLVVYYAVNFYDFDDDDPTRY